MGLDVLWSVSESKARGFGPSCGMVGVQQSLSYSSLWNVLGSSWDRTGCRFVVFGVRESFLSLSGVIWLVLCVTWICIGPSMCDMVLERSFLWNNLGQRPHGWSCWWNVWASKVPVFSLECLGLERSWLALPWRVWTETYSFNPFSLEFLAVCVCPFFGTSGGRQLVIGSALLRFQIFGVTQFAILFLWSVCGRYFIWSDCLWLFLDRTVCPSPGVFGVRKPVIAQATGVFHWCFSSVWDQTVPDWSCF